MTLKQVGLFFWYLVTSKDTEKVRQAEIDAFGGGSGPKK
jgi:hypothetical protein